MDRPSCHFQRRDRLHQCGHLCAFRQWRGRRNDRGRFLPVRRKGETRQAVAFPRKGKCLYEPALKTRVVSGRRTRHHASCGTGRMGGRLRCGRPGRPHLYQVAKRPGRDRTGRQGEKTDRDPDGDAPRRIGDQGHRGGHRTQCQRKGFSGRDRGNGDQLFAAFGTRHLPRGADLPDVEGL